MRFKGGEIAPRSGIYPVSLPEAVVIEDLIKGHKEFDFRRVDTERRILTAELEAGSAFPGDSNWIYEVGELKQGERAPRAGVYFCMGTHTEHLLAAGEAFPDADGDPKHADDYVLVREA